MTDPTIAYIALGSNVGDRRGLLRSAIRALDERPGLVVREVSTIRETPPVGPPGQGPYLNAVAMITTTLAPRAVLEACLAIERDHGRERTGARWGPRRLDLDLLLYGDRIIDEPGLTVPHPRLHERSFVLEPLAEIAGHVVHPGLRLPVESLWNALAAGESQTEGNRKTTCDGTQPASSS